MPAAYLQDLLQVLQLDLELVFLPQGRIAFSGHYGECAAEPGILCLHLGAEALRKQRLLQTAQGPGGHPAS